MKYTEYVELSTLHTAGFDLTEKGAEQFGAARMVDEVARKHGKHPGQCEGVEAWKSFRGGFRIVFTWADEGPVKGAPGYQPPRYAED